MMNLSFPIRLADHAWVPFIAFTFPHRLSDWAGFYNYVEVGLWPAMALVMIVYAIRRRGIVRIDCIVAAVTLVLFGASDWFEAGNGNEWWHPWWLLLWKVVCGATLFVLVIRAAVRRKASASRLAASEAGGMIGSASDARGR